MSQRAKSVLRFARSALWILAKGAGASGRFLWRHRRPILWGIGIYVSIYQLALNGYNTKIDRLETRLNFVISQRSSPDFPGLFPDLGKIQRAKGPAKPDIFNPKTTLSSFFNLGNKPYTEYVNYVKQYAQKMKSGFAGYNIEGIDLSSTVLSGKKFDGAYFTSSNLSSGYFVGSSFKGAVFPSAIAQCGIFWEANFDNSFFISNQLSRGDVASDFRWASFQNNSMQKAAFQFVDFRHASFNSVTFDSSDFSGAILDSAIFLGASSFIGVRGLTEANICKPLAYAYAKLDSATYNLIKRLCPEKADLSNEAVENAMNTNFEAQRGSCGERKNAWGGYIENINDFGVY